jgi:hypothetical protein
MRSQRSQCIGFEVGRRIPREAGLFKARVARAITMPAPVVAMPICWVAEVDIKPIPAVMIAAPMYRNAMLRLLDVGFKSSMTILSSTSNEPRPATAGTSRRRGGKITATAQSTIAAAAASINAALGFLNLRGSIFSILNVCGRS